MKTRIDVFVYQTGEEFFQSTPGTKFLAPSPFIYDWQHCLIDQRGWVWQAELCGSTWGIGFATICKRVLGYERSTNGKYYKVIHKMNLNHQQAKQICSADGAALAIAPYGSQDKRAVEKYIVRLAAVVREIASAGFWVDGTDAALEGTWKLPDG
jgi:hypothetical protein